MSFISQFNSFRFFPQNLKQNIKCFHVFEEVDVDYQHFAYCVTNDDCVYGLGDGLEIAGCVKQDNEEFIKIIQLCDKSIEEFFHSTLTTFALSSTGKVYYWTRYNLEDRHSKGGSYHGQYSEPKLIEYFNDKDIVQIHCSRGQCSALSSNGMIYSCEFEKHKSTDLIFEPKELFVRKVRSSDDLVKYIFSTDVKNRNIFKVTINGELYQIDCTGSHFENILYQFNKDPYHYQKPGQFQVEIINTAHKAGSKFTMIIFYESCVYEYIFNIVGIQSGSKLTKTNYKSIFDYFLAEYQKTYKTVHKIDDKFYIKDLNKDQTNGTLIKTLSEVKTESNIFNGFQSVNNLPNLLGSGVKSYFYTRKFYSHTYSALFVKSDGTVWVIGNNIGGQLGLGDKSAVNKLTPVPELCAQNCSNIEDIFVGLFCMFARNDQDEIYEWGTTKSSHLIIEEKTDLHFYKPRKIEFFQNKKIVQIICGTDKSFAMSRNGIVYGWDISLPESKILQPFNINEKHCRDSKIKLVYCYNHTSSSYSFFVTTDDKIYFVDKDWNTSRLSAKVEAIKRIIYKCLKKFVLIILNDQGKLFIHDFDGKTEPIEFDSYVKDIHDYELDSRVTVLECEYECVYELTYDYVKGSSSYMYKIKDTNYINYFDYLQNIYNTTEKLIHVSKEGFLYTKSVKFNDNYTTDPNEDVLICVDENIYERKFNNLFTDIVYIGGGGFGDVFKVVDSATKEIFAIKRTKELDDKDMKAIKSLINEIMITKLESDFVVQFYDSWIEGTASYSDDLQDIKINKQLYFRMDLCLQSLEDFLKVKREMFMVKYLDIDYYISCLLFKELTECVRHLHGLESPIWHRDLKPLNVLISDGSNGRFLKLCDFGLSKIIKQSNVTEMVESDTNEDIKNVNKNCEPESKHTRLGGTDPFMAPEVKNNPEYNEKCDIYSLALIAIEIYTMVTINEAKIKKLFDEKNLYHYFTRYSCPLESVPNDKIKSLKVLLEKCIFSEDYNQRPSCQQIIEKINELFINETDLQNIEEFLEKINELEDDCPFRMYCQKKLSLKS